MNTYYSIEMGGSLHDIEVATKEAAIEWAEERLADYCLEENIKHKSVPSFVVRFDWNGVEFVETLREPVSIDYEFFNERKEWGTY